jgi:hypothetical protein
MPANAAAMQRLLHEKVIQMAVLSNADKANDLSINLGDVIPKATRYELSNGARATGKTEYIPILTVAIIGAAATNSLTVLPRLSDSAT